MPNLRRALICIACHGCSSANMCRFVLFKAVRLRQLCQGLL